MKLFTLACLVLALAVQAAVATGETRHLLEKSEAASTVAATGSASVSVTGKTKGGRVKISAEAVSEAYAKAKNALVEIYVEAISKNTYGDAEALAKGVAEATAYAVASAYTFAQASIESEGKSEGCASVFASAEATATAFAKAVVEAVAIAANYNDKAQSKALVEAVSVETASAFAEAEVNVCLIGDGYAEVFQESFAEALVEPFAKVLVVCFAGVYAKKAGVAEAEVTAESGVKAEETSAETASDVAIVGKGAGTASGKAEAATFTVPSCKDEGYGECCKPYYGASNRTCRPSRKRPVRYANVNGLAVLKFGRRSDKVICVCH